jgi:hypothetical protein
VAATKRAWLTQDDLDLRYEVKKAKSQKLVNSRIFAKSEEFRKAAIFKTIKKRLECLPLGFHCLKNAQSISIDVMHAPLISEKNLP